jgi:hypothetical protein
VVWVRGGGGVGGKEVLAFWVGSGCCYFCDGQEWILFSDSDVWCEVGYLVYQTRVPQSYGINTAQKKVQRKPPKVHKFRSLKALSLVIARPSLKLADESLNHH